MDRQQQLETLGKKIKKARIKKKFTLKALEKVIGYSASIISRWERGLKEPKYIAIKKMEKVLRIEL